MSYFFSKKLANKIFYYIFYSVLYFNRYYMKASDIFVETLIQNGVKTIYGVPWEENLDLLDSIRKSQKIDLILTRNEQTAVFMASTYGRLTGEVGVAIATLWPWATNMVTGVAYAQLWGFPLMVITGQKPIKKSKQWQFQIIDVVGMMKPITKFATTIVSGNKIPYTLQNAFKIAKSERPGAVHIELPEDIASEEVSLSEKLYFHEKVRRPVMDEKAKDLLVKELSKAKKPMILIGAGANRKRIRTYLSAFIEKYNIPFFTSQMGKWVLDERMEQYIGSAALTSGDGIHDMIQEADLILSVWYDPIEKPTHVIGEGGVKNIHINFYEAHLDEVYAPYLEIIGDIGNIFWQLTQSDIDTDSWDFESIYTKKKQYFASLDTHLRNEVEAETNILWPRQLVADVRAVLQEDDIVALDNGLYKVWFARNYSSYHANTLLLDNALATMGAGVASWLEAKRIFPEKKVVVVTGDGGLVMNLGDLETVVRLWVDLTVVVLNNASYGMIEWKQSWAGMEKWGLHFGNPNFVELAKSFGWKWYKVNNKHYFRAVLDAANKEKGLKIIDVTFDYPQKIQ